MKTTLAALVLVAAALPIAAAPGPVQAQPAPTIEEVRQRLEALEEGPSQDAEAQDLDARAEPYREALAALERAAEARARARELAAQAAEAPALAAALRTELSTPEPPEDLAQGLSLQELQGRLDQAQADLEARRAELRELDRVTEHRAARKAELPEEIAAAQGGLATALEALAAIPDGAGSEPRRTLASAEVEELRAEIAALEAERDHHEARREVLTLRRDRALREVARSEAAADFWKDRVDLRRAAEGEAAARTAEERLEEITRRFPALAELAAETRALAAQRTGAGGLPQRISRAQADLQATRARLEEVRRRYGSARRRIAVGGLTESMGIVLRRDYAWLPEPSELRAEAAERERELSAAQVEEIAADEERSRAGDVASTAQRLLSSLGVEAPTDAQRQAARVLLTMQRETYDALLDDLTDLTAVLFDSKEAAVALRAEARAYRKFIESRILWVRSSAANPLDDVLAAPGHAMDLARAFGSSATLESMGRAARRRAPELAATGIVLAALLALRRFLKRKREEMASHVRSFRTDKYVYTLRALVQSLLLALPFPLVAWTASWLLSAAPSSELLRAAGAALGEIAGIWLVLRLLRELAAGKGAGVAHFKWPASSAAALRRELRWFEPLAVCLGWLALMLDRQSVAEWTDSVGRLGFVGAMAALAVFAHRLLRAESQMWAVSPLAGKGLLGKTHAIWSLVASGLPVALAVLALAGYYYTALEFELRLRHSIGFAAALVLVNALLLRWLFMTRRRLAVKQALEAKARREEGEGEADRATESGTAAVDADKLDIPAIDAQTRQLFKTSITLATVVGLYLIWASVLPALRGFDRVQLLPRPAIVSASTALEKVAEPSSASATTSAASPATSPASPQPIRPEATAPPVGAKAEGGGNGLGLPARLTLADVLLALVFVLLTSVAAKNLPALLELALLQRLPLDSGARYAVSTILRYVILIAGVSAVSGALGIRWEQVQWLAAALTFGLAFGLQEIFANFASGLIILLERPIRVGDIVSVGGTEGRVTQLRMRATTVMDWDRRELLIPNKEFITASVINWTLSDPITRVVVPVGIAYGSDTAAARKLLLEVATANPLVLESPAPNAIFRSFGASSLDFELRIYIANRDVWPEMIDKIHGQIDDAFRRAGIEIAFPQRDLHIRSAAGLREALRDADRPAGEE